MLRTLLVYLSPHLKRHKFYFLGALVCTVATNAISAFIPKIIQKMMDTPAAPFAPWIGVIVLLAFATFIVRPLSRYWFFVPGRMMEFDTRNSYFQHLFTVHPDKFRKFSIGDLLSRSNQDVQAIRFLSGFVCLSLIHVTSSLALNLTLMSFISLPLTLVLAGFLGLALTVVYQGNKKFMGYNRRFHQQMGALTDTMTQILYSSPLLRNYQAEEDSLSVLDRAQKEVIRPQMKMIRIRAWILPLVGFGCSLSLGGILLLAGLQSGSAALTVGGITAYLGHVALLVSPLTQMSWMISMTQNAATGIERINEIQDLKTVVPFETQDKAELIKNLSVRHLNYHSEPLQRNVLTDINLQWKPGQTFGFFGPSGSGKSLLFRTVSGVGSFEGAPVFENDQQLEMTDLLQKTIYVPQTPFLFSETIRRNITLGRENITDDDIVVALEHAGLELDPYRFPEGLETKVGQKGVFLSGGQRQRISLARAFVSPHTLLLLDDVLSAVDHETERWIIEKLYKHYRNPGFWIASHRISVLQPCDVIFCLDQGRLEAQGTHEQLLQDYAPYARVLEAQIHGRQRDKTLFRQGGSKS